MSAAAIVLLGEFWGLLCFLTEILARVGCLVWIVVLLLPLSTILFVNFYISHLPKIFSHNF